MFIITDRFTNQVVANRKTLNAARKWAVGLNQALPLYNNAPRYAVSMLEAKA